MEMAAQPIGAASRKPRNIGPHFSSTVSTIISVSKESSVRLPGIQLSLLATGYLLIAGCASAPTTTVKKTLDNPEYTDHAYSDILVIGVGGDYDNRAAFERAMVSRIAAEGAAATAYYTVVGRNHPITRTTVSTAVRSRGFDAVLLTCVISQETSVAMGGDSSQTKVSRKSAGRAIDLFRYDYDELIEPGTFNVSSTVTLSAEMFSGPDETRMWAIESMISDKETIGQIIESAADTIMGQLKKDQLIGR
jgi:hypothetical protein